jgi:hypothetical protein
MGVVELEAVRNEKKEKCDYCGSPEHGEAAFACPRIRSVTFDNETDEVTIRLWHPDSPSIPVASKSPR